MKKDFSNKNPKELVERIRLLWKNLYKNNFNLDIDPSIIEYDASKWEIFIAKELTVQQVIETLPFNKRKLLVGSVDKKDLPNKRASNKDYVLYVDRFADTHEGLSLLERSVLELKHIEETSTKRFRIKLGNIKIPLNDFTRKLDNMNDEDLDHYNVSYEITSKNEKADLITVTLVSRYVVYPGWLLLKMLNENVYFEKDLREIII